MGIQNLQQKELKQNWNEVNSELLKNFSSFIKMGDKDGR